MERWRNYEVHCRGSSNCKRRDQLFILFWGWKKDEKNQQNLSERARNCFDSASKAIPSADDSPLFPIISRRRGFWATHTRHVMENKQSRREWKNNNRRTLKSCRKMLRAAAHIVRKQSAFSLIDIEWFILCSVLFNANILVISKSPNPFFPITLSKELLPGMRSGTPIISAEPTPWR